MFTGTLNKKIDINFIPNRQRYTDNLSCMIRCRTISAKEHYSKAEFEKFDKLMRNRYPNVFGNAECFDIGDGTFLKIKGEKHDSPLVLMSHTDVVSAKAKKWKHPPFAADIDSGRIWGRGTVDTKGSLCAIFEAVESLIADGFKFENDLYILSSGTEEIAGNDAPKAVEILKKDGIVPKLVVDEGGAVLKNPIPFSKVKRFAMIGVTERSSARLLLETASEKEAKKLKKSVKRFTPGHYDIIPATRELLSGLALVLPYPLSSILEYLSDNDNAALKLLTHIGADARSFCGAVCSTPKLTDKEKADLGAGNNSVVINISGNYYNSIDDLIKETEVFAEKSGFRSKLLRSREAPEPVNIESDGCRFVGSTALDCFEKIAVLPYPVLGGTDARHFIGYAENVVRFIPVEINIRQLMSFHNKNENVYIDSLVPAVGYFRELIERFNLI